MKTCPRCHMSGIPEEAKFCPKCGAKIVRRKIDSQQLLNEALSAWEKYPGKPKNENLKKKGKVAVSLVLGQFLWPIIYLIIGVIENDIDSCLKLGIQFLMFGGGLMILISSAVLFEGYNQDKTKLEKIKNAFIKRYIHENEYE